MVEQAAIGASALLPEEYEKPTRETIAKVAGAIKEPFAPAPGYEDSVVRKLSESVGSTGPFLLAGPFGLAGRIGAVGLGVGAGAGEARTRAEAEGATEEQRGTATALGTIPGAFEAFAPLRILSRIPTAAKARGVELVKRAAVAGGEEAAQEAASNFAQNLIAQGVYKPEQELIEGLGESAAYGGATGAIVQGLMDLALGRRARGAQPAPGAPAGETLIDRATRLAAEKAAAEKPAEEPAAPVAPDGITEPTVRKPGELPDTLPQVLDETTVRAIGFAPGKGKRKTFYDKLVGKDLSNPKDLEAVRSMLENFVEKKRHEGPLQGTGARAERVLGMLPAPPAPPVLSPAPLAPADAAAPTPAAPAVAETPAPPVAPTEPPTETPRAVEPVEPSSGAGAPVVGEPPAVAPAEGVGAVESVPVVPAVETAGEPDAGEGAEPGAVAPDRIAEIQRRIENLRNEWKAAAERGEPRSVLTTLNDEINEAKAELAALSAASTPAAPAPEPAAPAPEPAAPAPEPAAPAPYVAPAEMGAAARVKRGIRRETPVLDTEADIDRALAAGLIDEETADRARAELIEPEVPTTAMGAAFQKQINDIKAQMRALLQKNKKKPAPNSKARKRYDELEAQLQILVPEATGNLAERIRLLELSSVIGKRGDRPVLDIPLLKENLLKAKATPRMAEAVLTYVGVDQDGNYLPTVYSREEAAEMAGLSRATGSEVSRAAEAMGIDLETRSRFHAGQTDLGVGAAKNVSEEGTGATDLKPRRGVLYETKKKGPPAVAPFLRGALTPDGTLDFSEARVPLESSKAKGDKKAVIGLAEMFVRASQFNRDKYKNNEVINALQAEVDRRIKTDRKKTNDAITRAYGRITETEDVSANQKALELQIEKGLKSGDLTPVGDIADLEAPQLAALITEGEAEIDTKLGTIKPIRGETAAPDQVLEEGEAFEEVEVEDKTSRLSDEYPRTIVSKPAVAQDVTQRTPSLKRRVDALNRKLEKGEITSDAYVNQLRWVLNDIDDAKAKKYIPRRVKGADYVRQRLLEAKRRGDLSEEAVDFAEWFIQRNPKLLDDLGISIRTLKEEGTGGYYDVSYRIAHIAKELDKPDTVVHEILHHLERMMPEDVQRKITESWARGLLKARKNAKTAYEKQYFDLLWNFHFNNGDQKEFKEALKLIQDGKVSYSGNYEFATPSEFWAVNGSQIMQGRFDVKGSVLGKLKQWLKEFAQKVKSVFGAQSNADIIRALDSLSKGDGKFVSKKMLTQRDVPAPKQIVAPETEAAVEGVDVIEDKERRSIAQRVKDRLGKNPALGVRAHFADSLAPLEEFFTEIYGGMVRTGSGLLTPMVKISRALDASRIAKAALEQGTIVDDSSGLMIAGEIKDANGNVVLGADGKPLNYVNVMSRITEAAEKSGKPVEEVRRQVDTVLYGHREYNLNEQNELYEQQAAAVETADPSAKGKAKAAKIREGIVQLAIKDKAKLAELEKAFQNDALVNGIGKDLDTIRFTLIDKLVEKGRISADKAQEWKDNTGYIPFERIGEYANKYDSYGRGTNRGVAALREIRKFEGSERKSAPVTENFANFVEWATKEAIKNDAAASALKDMELMGAAFKRDEKPEKDSPGGTVDVFENGKPTRYYVPDPGHLVAFSLRDDQVSDVIKGFQKASQILRAGVTSMPPFAMKQIFDDIARGYAYTNVKDNKALIANSLKNFPRYWVAEIFKKRPKDLKELESLGIVGTYDFTGEGNVRNVLTEAGVRKESIGTAILRIMEAGTKASDAAVRRAVYDQVLKETGDKAQAESAAREIINFSRRGSSRFMQNMIRVVPFFNAYAQGMDKLATAAAGGIVGRKTGVARAMFYKRMLALTTLGTMYALMMADDDEYQALPDHVRDTNWILPYGKQLGFTPGIPVPAELAFFFKAIPERVIRYYKLQGTEDEQAAVDVLGNLMKRGVDVFSSPNALAQGVRPLLENFVNYSFFLGRPLESASQERDRPFMRYGTGTSDAMKVLAEMLEDAANKTGIEAFAISPIKLENAYRGIFGTIAGLSLAAADAWINPNRTDRPLYRQVAAQITPAGAVMKDAVGTRYLDMVYDLEKRTEQVYNTYNSLLEKNPEKVDQFLQDNIGLYTIREPLRGLMEAIRALNAQARVIDADKTIDPTKRRKEIDRLRAEQNSLARQAYALRRMAFNVQMGL